MLRCPLCQQRTEPVGRHGNGSLHCSHKPDHTERAERWIQSELAEGDLFTVKRFIILRGRQLQHGVIGHRRLDQRAARQSRPAAPADHLGDQAEDTFVRPESLAEKQRINTQNPYQRDFFKIQALGHHLGAQQDVIFLPPKLCQHRFVGVFLAGGILVHPQDPCSRQQFRQFLFHALRAETTVVELSAAFRASLWQRTYRMPAMMAHQSLLRFVIDHRHAAIGAFQHMAAGSTHCHRIVPAPVQKQNALFPVVQVLLQFPDHPGAYFPGLPAASSARISMKST